MLKENLKEKEVRGKFMSQGITSSRHAKQLYGKIHNKKFEIMINHLWRTIELSIYYKGLLISLVVWTPLRQVLSCSLVLLISRLV